MITAIIVGIILWLIVMTILLTPARFYKSNFDRLTRARYRDDKVNLQIMLDHLRSFPEQWSVSRDAVSFPLQGAKQIYLTKEKNGWEYTLSSFESRPRPLDGYFGAQYAEVISEVNNRRENVSLIRNFYPELDGTLLLGNYKK